MSRLKAWVAAARLRTLPLSVSGVVVGSSLGLKYLFEQCSESMIHPDPHCPGSSNILMSTIFWLAVCTTIGFQVLSNFANDYGDGVKGTDLAREGERRMVASGMISPKAMKLGMVITAALTLFLASVLIFMAFGNERFWLAFIFFNLAIAAVIAAVKYTVGSNAYGYSGKGDIFVFLFFGMLSVLGSYFLFTKSLHWELVLPASSVGLFSASVLNLNNMRDIDNDAASGKNTMVVKLGIKKAKVYHYTLVFFGIASAFIYTWLNYERPLQFVYSIAFIPLLVNLIKVYNNKDSRALDSELKKVALSTFAFAILFSWLH